MFAWRWHHIPDLHTGCQGDGAVQWSPRGTAEDMGVTRGGWDDRQASVHQRTGIALAQKFLSSFVVVKPAPERRGDLSDRAETHG